MAIGRRKEKQSELFIPAVDLATGSGHPFYSKLNEVLADAGFDQFVEKKCGPYYKEGGRPGIPPGVYFRMLFIGYFEGLEIIRQRLPASVFDAVFTFVLALLEQKGLLRAKTVGIDATTLEANAAMKSIVRKDTGADWNEYLRTLARAEGIENPTAEDLRRMDRGRTDKKVPNEQWQSPTDPDSRIAKMKDGRTHLAYKAEHAVDLVSEAIVAAVVTHADKSDAETAPMTLSLAEANVVLAGSENKVSEVVMDKGYHDNRLLAWCAKWDVRTYIPERRQKVRRWADKPAKHQAAFRANRRRVRGAKGRRLNRWRSERCERTFAHVCETGGGRRTWLRGQQNVIKAHTLKCAAYNLGLLLRKVWGFCKPRNAEAAAGALFLALLLLVVAATVVIRQSPAWMISLWLVALIGANHLQHILASRRK